MWKIDIWLYLQSINIWPHVDKTKKYLRGGKFSLFSKICLHFSAVCLQFLKKNCHLSNKFWLYQHEVKYCYFRGTDLGRLFANFIFQCYWWKIHNFDAIYLKLSGIDHTIDGSIPESLSKIRQILWIFH